MTSPQTPRRSLLLTYHDPQCTNYGAGQRTHFLLKALGQYATTDVVLLSETDTPNHTSDLPAELGSGKLFHLNYVPKNLLDRAWCGLPSKRLSTLLANIIDFDQYDCIVCRYITPYLKFNLPGNKPLIIDFDDPIYSISWSLLNSPRAILKEAVKWLNQRLITWRLNAARLKSATFLFVCERDQKAFPQLKGGLLSNMPAFPRHPADYSVSDGKTLLFVGFMSWQPNISAVDHFLAHIWPKILEKTPTTRFRIVGKATPTICAAGMPPLIALPMAMLTIWMQRIKKPLSVLYLCCLAADQILRCQKPVHINALWWRAAIHSTAGTTTLLQGKISLLVNRTRNLPATAFACYQTTTMQKPLRSMATVQFPTPCRSMLLPSA